MKTRKTSFGSARTHQGWAESVLCDLKRPRVCFVVAQHLKRTAYLDSVKRYAFVDLILSW